MSIKEAAVSLCHFNKVISKLPETQLKQTLKAHINQMTYTLLCERVKRNQLRNVHFTSPALGSTLKREFNATE